jgi:hypothetical protein
MSDLRFESLWPERQIATQCWLNEYLPAEVFSFSWVRAVSELLTADELRTRYLGRRTS